MRAHTQTHTHIYIYTYIWERDTERERERERERGRETETERVNEIKRMRIELFSLLLEKNIYKRGRKKFIGIIRNEYYGFSLLFGLRNAKIYKIDKIKAQKRYISKKLINIYIYIKLCVCRHVFPSQWLDTGFICVLLGGMMTRDMFNMVALTENELRELAVAISPALSTLFL